ncbi:MAG: hypothetical protein ACOX15_07765 [Tepidanaerobacteraceae bacterium]
MSIKHKLDKILGYNGPQKSETFSLEETQSEKLLASDGDMQGDMASLVSIKVINYGRWA